MEKILNQQGGIAVAFFIFAVLIIGLLVWGAQDRTKSSNDSEALTNVEASGEAPDTTIKICQERATVTEKDQCFMSLATTAEDPDVCEMIEEDGLEGTCYGTLGKTLNDPQWCERARSNSDRDDCFFDVATEVSQYIYCERVSDQPRQDACYRTVAIKTHNPGLCEQIADSAQQQACKTLTQGPEASESASP